jgi:hypothetical protein
MRLVGDNRYKLIDSFIVIDKSCYQTFEVLHICAANKNRRTSSLQINQSAFRGSVVDRAVDTTELIAPSGSHLRKELFLHYMSIWNTNANAIPIFLSKSSSRHFLQLQECSGEVAAVKKKQTAQISSKSTVSLPPLTDPPHDPGERHLRDVLHAFSQYNTITSLSPGNSNLLNFPSKAFFGSLNQPNPSQDLGRGRRRRLTQRRRHLSRLVLRNRRLLLVLLLVGRDHVHCRAAVPRLVVLFDRGFKERGEGRVSNCSKPKRGFVLLIESKKKQLSYLSCSWDRTGAWEAGSACCGA